MPRRFTIELWYVSPRSPKAMVRKRFCGVPKRAMFSAMQQLLATFPAALSHCHRIKVWQE